MHHPGPPRFVATGEAVELAPRDPDPSAAYAWRLVAAPDDSTAALGDDPVEHLAPDAPGVYVARLSAPDGEHDLTVRAFPGDLAPGAAGGSSGESGSRSGPDRDHTGGRSAAAANEADTSAAAEGKSESGGGGRPRVELSAVADGDEVVVRADPRPNPRGTETAADLDVEFLLDDRDPLDRDAVRVTDRELAVPLDRLPDRVRVHAVAVGEHGYSVPDAVELEATGEDASTDGGVAEADATVAEADAAGPRSESTPAALARDVESSKPYEPPAWAEDAVIYEIYVRTFAGRESGDGAVADEREGDCGAFGAVRDRLDYLESLGVDVLWLTPVLENDHAPHGYNVTDFFAIADDLGTREDYLGLIEAAHDRGMRVLFDLVCNHSARDHPFFRAAVSDQDSEYREWYEWRTETEPETYFDWEYIANFDFDHLPVRRHLLDAVDEWAALADGFRCDMAWAVPDGFWREVHDRVKARDPEFLLLDETIPYIPDFQAGLFDVHFDSTTYAALRRVGRGDAPATDVLDAVDERAAAGFPDYAGFMLYAENHDETRYLVECGRPAAEAALGALFTLPGAPMVYAGQEFGQRGKRDDLAWAHADEDLREYVAALSALRHEEAALAAGADLRRVGYEVAEGDADRVVAYARTPPEGDPVAVVLNFGDGPATVSVDAAADATDLVTGEDRAGDGGLVVESAAAFRAVPSVGGD